MNRNILLQRLVDKYKYKQYLEIGTFKGSSFLPLRCQNKTAVDPNFKITKKDKFKWMIKNPCNIRNKYFEMESDKFFKTKKDYLDKKNGIDLFFIDGLHTFNASLQDVMNSFPYLSETGSIVMHDCYPPHKPASTPAESAFQARMINGDKWLGDWCGDVWKTVVYLKAHFKSQIEINVINADFGLGIIKLKGEIFNTKIDDNLYNRVNLITYEDLINDTTLINLKDPVHWEKYI